MGAPVRRPAMWQEYRRRRGCTFRRTTFAGPRESHVHDVTITREAPNYAGQGGT